MSQKFKTISRLEAEGKIYKYVLDNRDQILGEILRVATEQIDKHWPVGEITVDFTMAIPHIFFMKFTEEVEDSPLTDRFDEWNY